MSEQWRYHDVGKRSMIVSEDGFTVIDACLKHGMARCIVAAHNAAVIRAADAAVHGGKLTDEGVRVIAEKIAPTVERPTYFVQATYATPNGNAGRWTGRMASKTGDILADAERIVRKYRRVAGKLDIKATIVPR